jgi:hypothetical protein
MSFNYDKGEIPQSLTVDFLFLYRELDLYNLCVNTQNLQTKINFIDLVTL